jgi:Na+-driven multidrug efflux pump
MYATLGGGLINAVLDPIFIFGFGWNIEGAAAASVIARFGVLFIALYPLIKTHALLSTASFSQLKTQWLLDAKAITGIAGPAMLTNLATPIGSSFVLKTMATYGDSAVAGAAILGRLTPVAFAAIFALSGSVGPIMAQNFGAKQFVRVRSTLKNAVMVNVAYVLLVWGLLYMAMPFIISAFDATAEAAMLIRFYLTYMVGVFSFTGMLFIANASFNNLGYAHLATLFNFSRALLGTIPFVMLFSFYFGARGVLVGELAAGLVFGSMALIVAFRLISRLESDQSATASKKMCADQVIAKGVDGSQWPYSSQQSQLGQRCSQMDADTGKAESGY